MVLAEADVGMARGARLPAGKLLSVLHSLVENIDRASPDMAVLKLRMRPASLGEEIVWWETSGWIRHVVEQMDGMLDCKGPEFGIGNIGPVDCSMKEHGASDRHHSLNGTFSNTIVMVGSNASESNDLSELSKVSTIFAWGEGTSIVTQILLHNDSEISTVAFILFLCVDGLVSIQMNLMGDEDVAGSMIDEDSTARILMLLLFLAVSLRKSSSSWANKVIDWHLLSSM
jgi:hypothetical protein